MPRTGTTLLHGLLAQDPAARAPLTWEVAMPCPAPETATFETDPRIAASAASERDIERIAPGFLAIHPTGAQLPQECVSLTASEFISMQWEATYAVPAYQRWCEAQDHAAVYRWHRAFLQHLQSRHRRERWVLKTPAHIAWMEELVDVFPDALFVQCHRDPAKIIPSLSNNLTVWRRTFSDEVKPSDFGMMEHQAEGLRKLAVLRARPEMAGRFFDAHYLDVQVDPVSVLRACYRQFGIEFSPQREASVRAWMEADRASHAKGPKHAYALDDFGLDLDKIDRVYADYFSEYNVAKER
jgi:hypothetical protein